MFYATGYPEAVYNSKTPMQIAWQCYDEGMSERLKGPLDLARAAEREAIEWDDLSVRGGISLAEVVDFHHVVQELDSQTPLLGREVRIVGRMLVPYMCVIDGHPSVSDGRFMVDTETSDEEGIYRGFAVRNTCFHDDEGGTIIIPRAVHMLYTGTESFLDSVGNAVTLKKQVYFPVATASVMAVEPYAAHSLEDLKNDRLTAELDQLMLGDSLGMSFTNKLHKMAQLFRYECRKYQELTPLLLQQLSYLNDANFLEDSMIETHVVIRDMDDGAVGLYGRNKTYGIAGESFHLSNISITKDGDAYLENPELYIKGLLLSEGRAVNVPVRYITNAHTVDSYRDVAGLYS